MHPYPLYFFKILVCETIYHGDEVDDDVANCVTEMICKDPSATECASEEKIPRQSCTVDQKTNKKVQQKL